MVALSEIYYELKIIFPFIGTFLVLLVVIVIFNFIMQLIKKSLLKRAQSKSQISNIKIFVRIVNVAVVLLAFIFAFLLYLKSWTSIGVFAGIITAALGFALQRPLNCLAAWVVMATKRPFSIGDRIKIGDVKGDVYDISLTHIAIDEVGGIIDAEEHSGRNILVPNHWLFEYSLINYTLRHDYVLGEVVFQITYDSNLDKAIKLAQDVADKHAKDYNKAINKETKIRVELTTNGIEIKVRYFSPAQTMQKVKSDITQELFTKIRSTQDIAFAHQHMNFILSNGKKKNKLTKK